MPCNGSPPKRSMSAKRCIGCNVERKLVYAEPAAKMYELRSYRCPRCKSILRIVEQREPVAFSNRLFYERRYIVRSILDFIDEEELRSFDLYEREVIEAAFRGASNDLRGTPNLSRMYPKVAGRIVEAVRSGERDPEKLRDRALTAFGRNQH
jgi:hypothetical protein